MFGFFFFNPYTLDVFDNCLEKLLEKIILISPYAQQVKTVNIFQVFHLCGKTQ